MVNVWARLVQVSPTGLGIATVAWNAPTSAPPGPAIAGAQEEGRLPMGIGEGVPKRLVVARIICRPREIALVRRARNRQGCAGIQEFGPPLLGARNRIAVEEVAPAGVGCASSRRRQ